MIRVKVNTYAELRRYGLQGREEFIVDLAEGARVRDLMESLEVPEHRVMLILKNGKKSTEEDPLSEGDAVVFFPVIGGG